MRYLVLSILLVAGVIFSTEATFSKDGVVYEVDVQPGYEIPLGVEILGGDFDVIPLAGKIRWKEMGDLKPVESVPTFRTVLVSSNPPVVEDTKSGSFFLFKDGRWYRVLNPKGVRRIDFSGDLVLSAPGLWKGVYHLRRKILELNVYLFSPYIESAYVFVRDEDGRVLDLGEVSGIDLGVWKKVFQRIVDFKKLCRIDVGSSSGLYRSREVIEIENTESNDLGWDLPNGEALVEQEGVWFEGVAKGAKVGEHLEIDLGECKRVYALSRVGLDEMTVEVHNSSSDVVSLKIVIETLGRVLEDSDPRPDDVIDGEVIYEFDLDPGVETIRLLFRR